MTTFTKRLTVLRRINQIEDENIRMKFAEKLFTEHVPYNLILKEIKKLGGKYYE